MIRDTTFAKKAINTAARFAPVVPLEIADALQQAGTLGNYHLLLAHDVLQYPSSYKDLYADRGYTILMDNSLIELGYAMPIKEVLDAARIVGAQYIILPDKLNDLEETIHMSFKGIVEFKMVSPLLRQGIGLLPVMQGKDHLEHLEFLQHFRSCEEVVGLCIPRVIADTVRSRKWAINAAADRFNIHLLGFSENLMDDIACARMPGVIGIDSAVPIRLGLRGLEFSLDNPQDAGKRECYWDKPYELPSSYLLGPKARVDKINYNLSLVRKFISR